MMILFVLLYGINSSKIIVGELKTVTKIQHAYEEDKFQTAKVRFSSSLSFCQWYSLAMR